MNNSNLTLGAMVTLQESAVPYMTPEMQDLDKNPAEVVGIDFGWASNTEYVVVQFSNGEQTTVPGMFLNVQDL